MNGFQFQTAQRIEFGVGVADRLLEIVSDLPGSTGVSRRCLFVTGQNVNRTENFRQRLAEAGVECAVLSITGEPSIEDVQAGVAQARTFGCDFVIAMGGGSALDAGKAVAALVTNSGEPLDYLEVVGAGQPLKTPGLPLIAIPTTAGTGSEVTRNAVLGASDHNVKVSLRSPYLLPAVAIVDPILTLSCPRTVTADCGLDALTQVIEPLVSSRANPLTDAIAREGIRRSARSLSRSCEQPDDLEARTDLCFASLAGGLALANSGLGAAHGFAGPLGGMFPIPHGAVCARLLPYVIETNVNALEADRASGGGHRVDQSRREEYLRRFQEIAVLLTGKPDTSIHAGVAFLFELCESLGIQPLRKFGVRAQDFPAIVAKAKRSSSMRGNCIELTDEELGSILQRAF